jgi:predicted XRE-type DNA-binding protein
VAARTGNSPTGPKATRLARQLALAYLVDRLVEDGTLTYAEAARRLGVSRARVNQIANLQWLRVAVQGRILAGEIDGTERDLRGS